MLSSRSILLCLALTTAAFADQVTLKNGATWTDADHDEFASGLPLTTGSPPQTSPITVTSPGSPQSGIEMWDTLLPNNLTQAKPRSITATSIPRRTPR